MARIQIDLPDSFIFSTDLEVRGSDVNYGGHVGNDRILSLMQEARILFYRSIGIPSELYLEGTIGHVISDAAIVYKSESFLGDVLVIKISVLDFTKYGFDMYYLLLNKKNGKEVARGKTGLVCFDFSTRKVAFIPKTFRAKLEN